MKRVMLAGVAVSVWNQFRPVCAGMGDEMKYQAVMIKEEGMKRLMGRWRA